MLIRPIQGTLFCCLFATVLSLASNAVADDPQLQFTSISELSGVVDIRNAGDGSGRLFFVEQSGRIFVQQDGETESTLFISLRSRVEFDGGEQGLLSMAFAPDYATSGYFYVWYTGGGGGTVLARLQVSDDPNVADPNSYQLVLAVPQPFPNHNGGRLKFGPDGMLYLGLGDGGGSSDPQGNGQDMTTLLGKLIRIDVDPAHGSYAVPADNPFVNDNAVRSEIWGSGLRNPWRIAFDTQTGELFIADVGQNEREEINVQPASSTGGENYGWDIWEGTNCFGGGACNGGTFTAPVHEYNHDNGDCSITGGEVYRGTAYPNLHGMYLYADYCTGRVWGLKQENGQWVDQLLADTAYNIPTFGLGEDGSVYMASTQRVYLVSDGEPVPEGFSLNAGFNDAWYNPATDGQGFLTTVFEGSGVIFLAWFTYDVERPPEDVEAILGDPGHRWLTAQGTFEGAVATMEVYETVGGVFDSGDPAPAPAAPIGTMTITWSNCNAALVSYDIPSLSLVGDIPIERVLPQNVALCEALQ
jgi:glucose/arabinose dehydrogenase